MAAWLVFRGRPAGPLLGSGIGVYAIYTYAQVVIGQEYLRVPGGAWSIGSRCCWPSLCLPRPRLSCHWLPSPLSCRRRPMQSAGQLAFRCWRWQCFWCSGSICRVGAGLLLGAKWALKVMYPLLTGHAFLAASVSSMAVVMYVRADPDASLALMAGFLAFALLFAGLAVLIYRPLFTGPPRGSSALQAPAAHAE